MKRPYSGAKGSPRQQHTSLVQPVTALALLRRYTKVFPSLLLGSDQIHATSSLPSWTCLRNGINQLSGPAGCAKTQIALSVCLHAALQGKCMNFDADVVVSAVYLSLGSIRHAVIAQRLDQMARASNSTQSTNEILRRILIKAVMSPDDLQALLHPISGELVRLLQQQQQQRHDEKANNDNDTKFINNIQVLVLDDIASLFRFLDGTFAARSAALFQLAASLKRISDEFKLPILVLNQVTSKISITSSSHCVDEPALGLSWAQCVNQTFSVAKSVSGRRTLTLDRSPFYGQEQVDFEVQDCGPVML
ncbi:hypothetical protein MPSEU_000970600 [Mayamaea pseudoterrestris]|nr:hypothetical protein MPSEU_000970600 [Mayamaea pseudoterrestris]